MGKRKLVALINLSSWCLVMVEWLFLAVPWGCLRFVIVVFPDHTHLLFLHPILRQLCRTGFCDKAENQWGAVFTMNCLCMDIHK